MEKRVGIITFHRVYNYGAVIQAYSLQKCIEVYGYKTEIIDFSREIQRDYTDVISKKNGIKRFVKSLMLLPLLAERKTRKKRFDDFINCDLKISKESYHSEEVLKQISSSYDAYVCGSDQIWNPLKRSDFSQAYMLDFAEKNKISYAPSIGTAGENELSKYKELLKDFKAISCREEGGAYILQRMTKKNVPVVLDPTLLVEKKEILALTRVVHSEPYLFYYSLDGYENRSRNMDILNILAEKFGLKLKIITPEWPYHKKVGEDIIDAGPKEFLTLIRNAALICTNSFHGTALAIKLEKPFFVLEDIRIKDERKRSLLNQLDLQNRIISTVNEANALDNYSLDYVPILKKLHLLKNVSEDFLVNALKDGL